MIKLVHPAGVGLVVASTILSMTTSVSLGQQSASRDGKQEQNTVGDISGKVVNESGQPLANATVHVRSYSPTAQGQNVQTDKDGNFQITGLDSSIYRIAIWLPSYTSWQWSLNFEPSAFYRIGDSVKIELIKGGVITGSVTRANGEPVIGVSVSAHLIRDDNNRRFRMSAPPWAGSTDDRGIYRIYGLIPGTYVVSAGGSPYDASYVSDTPTYAPSSSRESAGEVIVRAGEESSNVDIKYRGELGYTVSGTVSGGVTGTTQHYNVLLTPIQNGEPHLGEAEFRYSHRSGFAFQGVADGDYFLTAQAGGTFGSTGLSERRKIQVRGADISGIELVTKPLASISGRILLEESAAPECRDKAGPIFSETIIKPQRHEKGPEDLPLVQWPVGLRTSPDDKGAFNLQNLVSGQYLFDVQTFAKYWYLSSISLPSNVTAGSTTGSQVIDVARTWTIITLGGKLSGMKITLAAGAASVLGRMKLSEGEKPAPGLFVYLVPAEKERAADVLRFFAAQVLEDGSFSLGQLPPGRYHLLAKIMRNSNSLVLSKLRNPDEAEFRTKLRHEAEAGKAEIELKPCQDVSGFELPNPRVLPK